MLCLQHCILFDLFTWLMFYVILKKIPLTQQQPPLRWGDTGQCPEGKPSTWAGWWQITWVRDTRVIAVGQSVDQLSRRGPWGTVQCVPQQQSSVHTVLWGCCTICPLIGRATKAKLPHSTGNKCCPFFVCFNFLCKCGATAFSVVVKIKLGVP